MYVPLQRARRKLRELVANSKAAATAISSAAEAAVASATGTEAVPSSSSHPSQQQMPPPSSTGGGSGNRSGGGGATDTQRLLQKVSEMEERLKQIEAARASGLETLRLTLQDGDKRSVYDVPLRRGGGGDCLESDQTTSLAQTPAHAAVTSPGGGVGAAVAVLGRWWGNGIDVLRSLAGGQKGGGSGSGN